jgi:hypothetical protein
MSHLSQSLTYFSSFLLTPEPNLPSPCFWFFLLSLSLARQRPYPTPIPSLAHGNVEHHIPSSCLRHRTPPLYLVDKVEITLVLCSVKSSSLLPLVFRLCIPWCHRVGSDWDSARALHRHQCRQPLPLTLLALLLPRWLTAWKHKKGSARHLGMLELPVIGFAPLADHYCAPSPFALAASVQSR